MKGVTSAGGPEIVLTFALLLTGPFPVGSPQFSQQASRQVVCHPYCTYKQSSFWEGRWLYEATQLSGEGSVSFCVAALHASIHPPPCPLWLLSLLIFHVGTYAPPNIHDDVLFCSVYSLSPPLGHFPT